MGDLPRALVAIAILVAGTLVALELARAGHGLGAMVLTVAAILGARAAAVDEQPPARELEHEQAGRG